MRLKGCWFFLQANQDFVIDVPNSIVPEAQSQLWPLAVLSLAVTIAIALLFVLFQASHGPERCASPTCTRFAELLAQSVNASINPCDSFGHFVCDGWRSKHELSVRQDVFRRALATTEQLVTGAKDTPVNQNAVQQSAALFRSCYVPQDSDEASEMSTVKAYLEEAGVLWPVLPERPDVLETVTFLAFELGWPALLDFKVTKSELLTTLAVEPADSFFYIASAGSHIVSESDKKKHFDALVQQFSGQDVGNVTFSDVQDAELLMAKRFRDALVPKRKSWELNELNSIFPAGENWAKVLARRNVTGELRFTSARSSLVDEFAELWKEYGMNVLHLYISWCAVKYVSVFASRAVRTVSIGINSDNGIARSQFCLGLAYAMVGDAIFAPYSTQVYSSRERTDVANIVYALKKAFTLRLIANETFSTAMIAEWALVKDVFKSFDYAREGNLQPPLLGYPDMTASFARNWRNLSRFRYQADAHTTTDSIVKRIMHSEFSVTLKNSQNFVLLPFALTFPIYGAGMSEAIKYATLGGILARASAEIVLDHYAKHKAARELLNESRRCFTKDTRTMSITPRDDVMLEAISLEVLLDAFEAILQESSTNRQGLGSYSATETFFLSWCLARCAAPRITRSADVDPCSATLRHVQRFSDTFGCQAETSLNPLRKCHLF
ncbi:hypothetical protein HPB48_005807 [Haemaphysalis longicornis]|uniref:Peptidase M13 N-terminal domain-containing protein n=1 Tax=Haemaphysalis longicornis TaxID=44386 RepID=A0A9J6GQS4_HAELO|nr:hypothetical protein HPB48_005807 [Haemaphysalis longicornis]